MKKAIIIIIVLLVVALGAYFLFKGPVKAPASYNQANLPLEENMPSETGMPERESEQPLNSTQHEIIYSDNGYSSSQLKIKVGDTVIWKNKSSSGMWTASAIHPSHTIYGGTSLDEHCPDVENISFDECKSAKRGESWSFRFDKKGTWRYHNHVKTSDFGTIVVE